MRNVPVVLNGSAVLVSLTVFWRPEGEREKRQRGREGDQEDAFLLVWASACEPLLPIGPHAAGEDELDHQLCQCPQREPRAVPEEGPGLMLRSSHPSLGHVQKSQIFFGSCFVQLG